METDDLSLGPAEPLRTLAGMDPDSLKRLFEARVNERAAAAEERARELRIRARQQEAVAELGLRALQSRDLAALMSDAAEVVTSVLGVRIAEVLEVLPDGGLVVRASTGTEAARLGPEKQAAYTLRCNEPVIVVDLRRETRFAVEAEYLDAGAVSSMSVVIQGREAPWGVLSAHHTEHRLFTRDDVNFFLAVANVVGSAVARQRSEVALVAETSRLAVTLRSIGDGVISTDTEGRVALMNAAAEEFTGWRQEEARGLQLQQVVQLVSERSRQRCEDPVRRVLRTGRTSGPGRAKVLVARDGAERIVADVASPLRTPEGEVLGAVLVIHDVTHSRKLEEELQKSSKLEAIGVLAGGIAHDFNNILTMIVASIGIAKMHAREDRVRDRLRDAETACARAQDLTRQLLTFAKGGAPIKGTISLADQLRETVGFALHGSSARPVLLLPDDLWPVEADAGQISQVIQNLVINAAQAMPEGGTIEVRAENTVVAQVDTVPVTPGEYVRVSVRDEGEGIPAEHLSRIFDPFYTTKPGGNGLGLATVYSIVNRHEGHISVCSVPGEGTTFTMLLPASRQPVQPAREQPAVSVPGRGRVLFMDDEPYLRRVIGDGLRDFGYEVTLAQDGDEALLQHERACAEGRRHDVVIMDLTVPGGMGGREAIGRLRAMDPHVRAIVSSGYSNDPVMSQFARYGFNGVLTKPYGLEDLLRKLDEMLG